MNAIAAVPLDEIKKGQISHSYLLEGSTPDRRFSAAVEIAAAILCGNRDSGRFPCMTCPACEKVYAGIHPDVSVRGRDLSGGGSFRIDEIRDIRSDAYVLPSESEYKIYILAQAHRLTPQAQNALLKIFEEPPRNVVFLLLAPFRAALLPTVVSRAKIYTLGKPSRGEFREKLAKEHPDLSETEIDRFSGVMSALSKTDLSGSEYTVYRDAIALCEMFFISTAECRLLEKLPKKREELSCVLNVLHVAARDIMLYKMGVRDPFVLILQEEQRKASGRFSMKKLMYLHDKFYECAQRLENYGNVNTIVSELSFITA